MICLYILDCNYNFASHCCKLIDRRVIVVANESFSFQILEEED